MSEQDEVHKALHDCYKEYYHCSSCVYCLFEYNCRTMAVTKMLIVDEEPTDKDKHPDYYKAWEKNYDEKTEG